MEFDILLQRLRQISENVPADEYPEVHQVLEMEEECDFAYAYRTALDYAQSFLEADSSKPMPAPVADFEKEVYEEEIANGSAAAANDFGTLYYSGRIGVQDFTKAVELYTLAASRGDRQAAENLGYCYRNLARTPPGLPGG